MWPLSLVACRAPEPPPRRGDDDDDTHSSVAAHSAAGAHSGAPTGHTGPVDTLDCAAVPPGPLAGTPLHDLQPSEDFAFDDEGHLLSASPRQLLRQEYPPGASEPFAPTGSDPSSMRRLRDGDLAVANIDTQTLYRVRLSDGATTPITAGFHYATGIDVHLDGSVFIGDADVVRRVDPATGDSEEAFALADFGQRGLINGLTFGPAYDELFIGVYDTLVRVPVDARGAPTGPATPVYTFTAPGELLGLGADACGSVYALFAGGLYRFAPDGSGPETLWTGGSFTTNLQWGSGVGGWDDHAVYVVDRSGPAPFVEIPVGVPDKPR